jgi:hypothetical protein
VPNSSAQPCDKLPLDVLKRLRLYVNRMRMRGANPCPVTRPPTPPVNIKDRDEADRMTPAIDGALVRLRGRASGDCKSLLTTMAAREAVQRTGHAARCGAANAGAALVNISENTSAAANGDAARHGREASDRL